MNMYVIDENCYKLLDQIKKVLYAPHIKTGDEIRDCAHQISYIIEHSLEIDSTEIETK